MCLAPKTMDDADSQAARRDVIHAADEVFVRAPPPACTRQTAAAADIFPCRAAVQDWAESLRAEAGLRALSAGLYRRRRALAHQSVALEFAERRKVEVGLGLRGQDELCRSVRAALRTRLLGSCAYCGCNFSVVAAWNVAELGWVCGVCGRRVRVHDPKPLLVGEPPENAEGRWMGWLPW